MTESPSDAKTIERVRAKGGEKACGKVKRYRGLAGYWKRSLNEADHEERRTKLRVVGGGEVRWKGRVARELARK